MRTYFINYLYPQTIGSFIVKAEDGIKASEKISSYLKSKGVDLSNSNSTVCEIKDGKIEFI